MHSPALLRCVAFGFFLFSSTTTSAEFTTPTWPGESTDWNGFAKFTLKVAGRNAYVVVPKHAAAGNPWIWRARFPDFHTEADLELLRRGFTIARVDTDGMLGSPAAMKIWDAFYLFLTERGLATKCCLEGVSRGGLFVYGFASRWPERVAAIYADTPVCDISSWPGGKGTGRGHPPTWASCLEQYGLTEASAEQFRGNPIDRLAPLAAAKIPLLHIISLNDEIVPPSENTLVLAERYRRLGGQIDVIEVAQGTPESGGHHFKHPDPVRVADFIEARATVLPANPDSKQQGDFFTIRGSLDNCRLQFEREKTGRVVFLGGSITTMQGWRNQVADYLQSRFPETKFDFIDAGIPSMGSTPAAFRLTRDVFSKGDVHLLFEEAAVNDLHNMRTPTEMIRGMEGIIRHARTINPKLDVIVMHFADQPHMQDYRSGQVPRVMEHHERVAAHYNVTTLNLAHQVTQQIDAGQFDWEHDFRDCHPSAFGHRLYAGAIRRLLATAWHRPLDTNAQPVAHTQPQVLDPHSYDAARLVPIDQFEDAQGFAIVPNCDPTAHDVGGAVRAGFANVDMLVGKSPGSEFAFDFRGRAVGLLVAAGPDAGRIEYSIDQGPWRVQDLFTKWSKALHLPWAYVLQADLDPGPHTLRVRIADESNPASKGTACRIVNFLINE